MGLFDYVRCKYKLPWPEAKDLEWQSKDTPEQYCMTYEIREDGTLGLLHFDTEAMDVPGSSIPRFRRKNEHWEQVRDFTGSIEIYSGEYAVIFWFKKGEVKDAVFYEGEQEVVQ